MMSLKKTINNQKWKHQLFPSLLLVVEKVPTWEARAEAFNKAGFRTYTGKLWTKQSIHACYHSYWTSNATGSGVYSWNQHGKNIEALKAMSVLPIVEEAETLAA
jgi:hypothetical protein